MPHLFDPLTIRSVEFKNRVFVSPMCEYSSEDGFANDWHLVHLGSRAVGGASLVLTEANAVTADGRISPQDLGIWKDDHIEYLSRITRFIKQQGSIPGTQLAHAGRKASTARPWEGGANLPLEQGGWRPIWAPSPIPFRDDYQTPTAVRIDQIHSIREAFVSAARRAADAGFEVIEIHAAHGYLLHEFLSPLSNKRTDEYGASFENRTRFVREVCSGVRQVWPESLPLFVRISCTDWVEGGWNLEESIELSRQLKLLGVDLIDCSSGGVVGNARIPVGPAYQAPFAERIRKEADTLTGAVGMITAPKQADTIIQTGQADAVLLAREFLRQPYWPLLAARELEYEAAWPKQYERAKQWGAATRS
jgi:2,4-dienoyl-CoA reductase-like NADH-dependent reductase (Old Yellow Enzyme family)